MADPSVGREKVVLAVVKTMKSPRSAVLKTSIMACADIFSSFGNLLASVSDDAFDKLVRAMSRSRSSGDSYTDPELAAAESVSSPFSQLLQLLLKASQDKRFVCEEAEKATRAMAASMPPLPLLKKLKAYVHHANLRVRAKAAVAISHCAARMVRHATPRHAQEGRNSCSSVCPFQRLRFSFVAGAQDIGAMKEFGMSALLQLAAELLNDRLPEAREAARGVVASTHAAFVKEAAASGQEDDAAASWESLCALSLPPISAQAVAKIAAAAASSQ